MTRAQAIGGRGWAGIAHHILRVAAAAMVASLAATHGTQDAVANGDTRTLSLIQDHTKETLTVTFKRNGSYDSDALKQLNWLLRDWRLDEQTRMDPRLFDVVWEVYREVGAEEPIHVVSGYRSPETNAMLRRRSRVVAEQSQHMRGKAMDFYLPGIAMSRVREIGMRLQDGGVGFYPNAFNPFVHLDVGSVRAWPRMTHDQLARLFPDGRTVHLPRDGKPLAGYEEAKAAVLAKGGSVAGMSTYAESEEEGGGSRKSLWAMLFGGGEDEDTSFYRQQRQPSRPAGRAPSSSNAYASAGNSSDGDARGFFSFGQPDPEPAPEPISRAAPEPARANMPPLFDPVPSAESGGTRNRSDGTPAIQMLAATPMPPRRPADLEPLLRPVLVMMPMPPARPITLASAQPAYPASGELKGQMRATPVPSQTRLTALAAPVPGDDRAALRSLFAAAVTPAGERGAAVTTSRARPAGDPGGNARAVFSAAETGLRADRFSGSALAPILR